LNAGHLARNSFQAQFCVIALLFTHKPYIYPVSVSYQILPFKS
jgi:hypothetical protein